MAARVNEKKRSMTDDHVHPRLKISNHTTSTKISFLRPLKTEGNIQVYARFRKQEYKT